MYFVRPIEHERSTRDRSLPAGYGPHENWVGFDRKRNGFLFTVVVLDVGRPVGVMDIATNVLRVNPVKCKNQKT